MNIMFLFDRDIIYSFIDENVCHYNKLIYRQLMSVGEVTRVKIL